MHFVNVETVLAVSSAIYSTIPDVSAGHVLTMATDHSSTVQYHSIKETTDQTGTHSTKQV